LSDRGIEIIGITAVHPAALRARRRAFEGDQQIPCLVAYRLGNDCNHQKTFAGLSRTFAWTWRTRRLSLEKGRAISRALSCKKPQVITNLRLPNGRLRY